MVFINYIFISGYIGSFLVSINLIPQIIRIVQKKSGKNISYFAQGLNILASIFMLIYSVDKLLPPVIISNTVIIISSLFIVFLKKYYSNKMITIPTDLDNNSNTNTKDKNTIMISDIENNAI